MKKKSFLNGHCAKTIGRIKPKFSHNVPLMWEKILSHLRNAHFTQRPLVAVFQKVSKNNMRSPRVTKNQMKKKSFLNEDYAKTIARILTKFSHNVPPNVPFSQRSLHPVPPGGCFSKNEQKQYTPGQNLKTV